MRCPKCGFISFDHLQACLKCGKDIHEASESLNGAVYNFAPPAFLEFEEREEVEVDVESGEEDFVDVDISGLDDFGDDEAIDIDAIGAVDEEEEEPLEDDLPDLDGDLLDEEDDVDIVLEMESDETDEEQQEQEEDFDFLLDEDLGLEDPPDELQADQVAGSEEEINIDMDLFEDPKSGDSAAQPHAAREMAVPAELLDLSDLAPPGGDDIGAAELGLTDDSPISEPVIKGLEGLDVDLTKADLQESKVVTKPQQPEPAAPVSPDSASADPETKKVKKDSIMDDDFVFELDLDGLSSLMDKNK